jgi:enamine deaminase RidA (YjgF/YER057c/UK114 family)
VYIAGQLGIDRDGKLSSNFHQQAVQTFENLKTALAAVDAQFQHVVKFNNYLIDLKHLPIFRQVPDSYLADERRPASTTLAISGLTREGALLEVEAVAVLPATAAHTDAAGGPQSAGSSTKGPQRRRK